MASGTDAGRVRLRVAVGATVAPGEAFERDVDVAVGATVGEVLEAAGLSLLAGQSAGVWGRSVGLQTVVAAGDRVELYRPLPFDAKEARRRRAAGQRRAADRKSRASRADLTCSRS